MIVMVHEKMISSNYTNWTIVIYSSCNTYWNKSNKQQLKNSTAYK